jgi:rhodanese-related sulfurtransferase/DNA-binding transcriptional ArsR family regulator
MRALKDQLYGQVARIGKVMASPKRLELIELLCQGEKSVELLAEQGGLSVKLASAHLRELRLARLVEARKEGRYVLYRLADAEVANLWVVIRNVAETRLAELQQALHSMLDPEEALLPLDRAEILRRAAAGEVIVLDVRPAAEYDVARLPHARSVPVGELRQRLSELPPDLPVVAYCRGPYCLMARQAVELLRAEGRSARHLSDGVAEWRARGLPIETPVPA